MNEHANANDGNWRYPEHQVSNVTPFEWSQ